MSTWLLRTSSTLRAFWRASMWDTVGSASGSLLTALSTLSFPDHIPLLFFPSPWSFGQTINYCSWTNVDLYLRASCLRGKWSIRYSVLNFVLDKISFPVFFWGHLWMGQQNHRSPFSADMPCVNSALFFSSPVIWMEEILHEIIDIRSDGRAGPQYMRCPHSWVLWSVPSQWW